MGNPHVMFPVKKDYPYRPIRFPDPNRYPFADLSETPIAEGEGHRENQCSADESCEDPATILNRKAHKFDPLFSSESTDWLTPKWVLDVVVECLGSIELDPCASLANPTNVSAERVYTVENDGLKYAWVAKTVFLNPPYGREDSPRWTSKLLFEFESGRAREIIALLPARMETKWFQSLHELPVCFPDKRVQFSAAKNGAPFPSALVYAGPRWHRFAAVFGQIGRIYVPVPRTGGVQ